MLHFLNVLNIYGHSYRTIMSIYRDFFNSIDPLVSKKMMLTIADWARICPVKSI